jgi:hypothetical protein
LSKPDRPVGPVEPGTGPKSGSVGAQNRPAREPEKNVKTGFKPEKTGRSGRFCSFYFIFFMEKHQVVWFCNSNLNQKLNRTGRSDRLNREPEG